ncbi:cell division protein FtsJ [Paenibacillus sp. N5-1-1-5]|uniref:Cell division protein FtsJ n=1 Tax=Paenibacillus radicis (ex Xue et al. 2023) TaxID=2972489 RepID=A0ABT1YHZ0_9BACL|nr:cyclic-phosphate processing receiver domain-containing protein [Paenibacillus radicis (ex Xue et al. 2023)]MCR8631873.1 cell division protein FtsJ [Paenibacillus radicis (ex Xue et al. 2023)]
MIHVYLDDMRPCPKGFVAAHSAEECILLLQECEVGILSLDFDLGWGQPDGLNVVHYIVAAGRYPEEIYLHTSSLSGKKAMYQLLYQNKPEGVQLINGPMLYDTLQKISNTVQE